MVDPDFGRYTPQPRAVEEGVSCNARRIAASAGSALK